MCNQEDHPCDSCMSAQYCDGYEARYCCALCMYLYDDPDCENCDPSDI